MIDLYGSLGSVQSTKCAGSSVFPANYMTGEVAPAPLVKPEEKSGLSTGAKVLLALGVVAAGVAVYSMASGAGAVLAANPVPRELSGAVDLALQDWLAVPVAEPPPGLRALLRDAGWKEGDVLAWMNEEGDRELRRAAESQAANASEAQVRRYFRLGLGLARRDNPRYTYLVRVYNERREVGELSTRELPVNWVWSLRGERLQVSPSSEQAEQVGVPEEILRTLPAAIASAPIGVATQVGEKGSYQEEAKAEYERFIEDFDRRHAADLPRWEREEREFERRYAAGLRQEERRARKSNDEYSPFPAELLPGGRASGMRPSDFDPVELRRGTEHELEHTDDWRLAQEIASDHLAEDEAYYQKLEAMERGSFRDNPKQFVVWFRLNDGRWAHGWEKFSNREAATHSARSTLARSSMYRDFVIKDAAEAERELRKAYAKVRANPASRDGGCGCGVG